MLLLSPKYEFKLSFERFLCPTHPDKPSIFLELFTPAPAFISTTAPAFISTTAPAPFSAPAPGHLHRQ